MKHYKKPKGRPREAWLRSDNPYKFAEAMLKCQHAGGYCAHDGFCHFDGTCFRFSEDDIYDEIKKIKKEIKKLKAERKLQ